MKIKKILLPLFIILFLFFLKTDSVLEAGGCPPDPTLTLTGSQVLKPGESTSFYYSIPSGWNKGACSMDGGNVSGSGTRTEWPSEDTTYRIVCSQEVCTKQKCSNTPEGMECECVATDTCSASSASYNIKVLTVKLEGFDVIQYYEYPNSSSNLTTLKWQASSGFDSCTASSNPAGIWSGSKPLSGSQDVAINQNTTFTLTCTRNSNPSYAKSASVTVSYTLSRCTDRAGCISVTPTSRQGAGPVTVNWTLNQAPDTYRVFYIEEGSDIIHPIIGTQSSGVPYSGSSSGSQTVNISKTTYFFLEMDKGSEHSCEDTGGGGSDDCCIGWLVNRTAGYVQLTGNNGTVYGLQSYGVWAGYIHNSRLGIYSSSGSTYTGCAYGTGGYGGPGGTVTTKLYRSCQLGLDGRLVCTVNCIDIPGWHAVEWAKAEVTSAPTACSCTATATPNPIPPGQSTTTIDVTNLNHTSKDKCKVENYNLPYTFTQTDSSKTYTVNCTGDSGYTNCTCDVRVTKGTTTPTVSCSASPNPQYVNQPVTWTATSSNFSGTPTYTWSGAVTGTGASLTTSYSNTGTSTANIVASYGTQTATSSCSVSIIPVSTQPDLIIDSCQAIRTNNNITVTLKEKNQGTADAGSHKVGLIEKYVNGAPVTWTKWESDPFSLSAGSVSNPWGYVDTCPATGGTVTYKAKADSSDQISESNETNNITECDVICPGLTPTATLYIRKHGGSESDWTLAPAVEPLVISRDETIDIKLVQSGTVPYKDTYHYYYNVYGSPTAILYLDSTTTTPDTTRILGPIQWWKYSDYEDYSVYVTMTDNNGAGSTVATNVSVIKISEAPLGACSCTATANPNPIPPGQSTTTIDVTNLNHTSKDKCKVENYNLPYTFTQTDSSKTYTVNCTGDSGYTNCTCDVTVTKGTGRCDCSNFTCSPSGTGPVCATDDDCTCSACWGSSGYICTTNSNCQAGTDKGLDHCPSGQTCCKPTTSAKYACNTNTWQCYQSSTGPYSSLTECQTNCHPSPVRYACNTNTWQCYQSSTGPYSSLTECQTNCHPSPVRYACNTTTWRCYQSDSGPYDSLGACENECKPFYCDTTNWQCYQDRNRHSSLDAGPYGSSGECIDNCVPCVITSFNFKPTKIFLSQTTTASWSTNACTNCQASCGPAGCGDWSGDKLTSGSQYVTPTAVGTYNYTLSCWNNKNGTSDTKEVPVEVYKAPIWREVAPKLGGYLWGIVFGK